MGLFVIQPCSVCDYTYTYMYYTQRPGGNFAYQNDPLCSGTTINFEVLTEVSLKVFWDVTLCDWVSSSDVLSKCSAFTFRIKTLQNNGNYLSRHNIHWLFKKKSLNNWQTQIAQTEFLWLIFILARIGWYNHVRSTDVH